MQQACFSPALLLGYASRILLMQWHALAASVRKGERSFPPFPGRKSTHTLVINGHQLSLTTFLGRTYTVMA